MFRLADKKKQVPRAEESEKQKQQAMTRDMSVAVSNALMDAFQAGKGQPNANTGFHVNNVGVQTKQDKTGFNVRGYLNMPSSIQSSSKFLDDLKAKLPGALSQVQNLENAKVDEVSIVRLGTYNCIKYLSSPLQKLISYIQK